MLALKECAAYLYSSERLESMASDSEAEELQEDMEEEEEDETETREKPNKVEMLACDIRFSAESETASVEELAEVGAEKMEMMFKYHLRGEMEVLEKEDLHSIIFD